ncbi:glycosyltransferase family 2 protein [Sulfitobacter sp. F26204]|uniref:glycosyltransferase family 2 protein n=1 Tax=Sulfitobacter sp. F26204 TaxID=2996014 RepID=UPI00225E57CB|nr:glycosyltransferase family 2 protein [Sulfitobacter sp. F26204]MCX7558739.1 glycosyltransferase family 2 protein [Sulfitobacter sp. F26204]
MQAPDIPEMRSTAQPVNITHKLVTLLVPVYNEQRAIKPFLEAIQGITKGNIPDIDWEILFVNDGSKDGTEFAIRSFMRDNTTISLINLSRNFGKEAALCAGMEHARGDAIIPIDVDLQDEPDVIIEMIEKWRAGAEIVNARRGDRSQDTWFKRTTAQGFYKVFNALADHPMPSDVGDFRLLDRQVVDVLRSMGERARLNKALFSWVGFQTAEVVYNRKERSAGHTTMGYWKLWNMALDGIFSSTTKPLRIWTYVGTGLAMAAFFYGLYYLISVLIYGTDVPGYASTLLLILAFGGMQLIAIGIVGEYVGRILTEVRDRPLYIVRSRFIGDDIAADGVTV